MIKKSTHFLITCEHASNALPKEWVYLFEDSEDLLNTHRGFDPGALELSKVMARELGVELQIYPWSRLLIEPNRSAHHTSLFSDFSKGLNKSDKEWLIREFWTPYRDRVREGIRNRISSNRKVIHISVHTFTPVWEGDDRAVDIGFLYDPKRRSEQEFCREWKKQVDLRAPDLRIRMNQPYKGSADGFTTSLRKEFSEDAYLGIELEVNQKFWFDGNKEWAKIAGLLIGSLLGR